MRILLLLLSFAASAFAQSGHLVVLNKSDNELVLVDPVKLAVVARVPTGEGPHEAAVTSDGRYAYVCNYGAQTAGNSFSVIDLVERKEVERIDLGDLKRPHGIQQVGGHFYFTAESVQTVARFDPKRKKVDWKAVTGQNGTHMVVISPDAKHIYTANIGSGTVTHVDRTGKADVVRHLSVGQGAEGIDLSPDGKELWVATRADGNVNIVDTATFTVKTRFPAGDFPIRVKFTQDGKRVLVTNARGGELVIYDAATRKELKRLKTGDSPIGIQLDAAGKRAYVASGHYFLDSPRTGVVFAIDLETMTVAGTVETGSNPDGMAWSIR